MGSFSKIRAALAHLGNVLNSTHDRQPYSCYLLITTHLHGVDHLIVTFGLLSELGLKKTIKSVMSLSKHLLSPSHHVDLCFPSLIKSTISSQHLFNDDSD